MILWTFVMSGSPRLDCTSATRTIYHQVMVRRFICMFVVFALAFVTAPRREPIPEARAVVAAVALAPEAVVAALELAILVTGAAYLAHVITEAQYHDYDSQMQSLIDRIQNATGEALHWAMNQSLAIMTRVMTSTHAVCLTSVLVPLLAAQALERRSASAPERRANPAARARAAECQATMMGCCQDFFEPYRNRMVRDGDSVKIFSDSSKRSILCCFNWDRKHKGLEIFNDRGIHQGERGCDDFNEDPCKYTPSRGAHGLPSPSDHKPSGLCRK